MFQKQKYDGEVQFSDSSSRGESLQTETSLGHRHYGWPIKELSCCSYSKGPNSVMLWVYGASLRWSLEELQPPPSGSSSEVPACVYQVRQCGNRRIDRGHKERIVDLMSFPAHHSKETCLSATDILTNTALLTLSKRSRIWIQWGVFFFFVCNIPASEIIVDVRHLNKDSAWQLFFGEA